MLKKDHLSELVLLLGLCLIVHPVHAQNEGANAADLAKKLSNPIASLISVPFQFNYDENIGPDDIGEKTTLNIQPVIPVSINEDWNLISRTILPVITQKDVVFEPDNKQDGIGDIVQSLFFSPVALTESGWTWGAGPVILLPVGSDEFTSDTWGLGPTAVALKQDGPWTIGGLFNHIWSVDESDEKPKVNTTFLQPFMAYNTPNAVTFNLNTESTYNWETEQWQVPINATVLKLSKIGKQLVSWGGGLRYYASSTDGGPEGWGVRLQFTFLFPR